MSSVAPERQGQDCRHARQFAGMLPVMAEPTVEVNWGSVQMPPGAGAMGAVVLSTPDVTREKVARQSRHAVTC